MRSTNTEKTLRKLIKTLTSGGRGKGGGRAGKGSDNSELHG